MLRTPRRRLRELLDKVHDPGTVIVTGRSAGKSTESIYPLLFALGVKPHELNDFLEVVQHPELAEPPFRSIYAEWKPSCDG